MTRHLSVVALVAVALLAGGTAGSLSSAAAARLEVTSAPLQVWDRSVSLPPATGAASEPTTDAPTPPAREPVAPAPAAVAPAPFEPALGDEPTPSAGTEPEAEPEPSADPAGEPDASDGAPTGGTDAAEPPAAEPAGQDG